jgi:hypothetical protein
MLVYENCFCLFIYLFLSFKPIIIFIVFFLNIIDATWNEKMAKKKIKANSLVGLWKNIHKIAPTYIESEKADVKELTEEINKILQEANESSIPNSIATSFIKPYMHNEECTVEFTGNESTAFGAWAVQYDDEKSKMLLDPIGVHKFVSTFKNAKKQIENDIDIKDDFKEYRQISFMNAISKLPEPYFFYIVVLQEIAHLNDIVSVENREGGYIKSEASFYLSALWAFKEFERFYLKVQHRHLRADYGIIWHEGEWVEDRKTKGYS